MSVFRRARDIQAVCELIEGVIDGGQILSISLYQTVLCLQQSLIAYHLELVFFFSQKKLFLDSYKKLIKILRLKS